MKIRFLTAPAQRGPARGSVIVCPGRTEFIEKYFEVVGELQRRSFAVFCIDWRGQGLSGREQSNRLKGHFNSFDDPVNDLAFVGMIQNQNGSTPTGGTPPTRAISYGLVYDALVDPSK